MAGKISSDENIISDINIVPLVDIILVVLIIFMVTAPSMIKPSIEVNLPSASSSEETEPSFLQVTVTSEGRILINNTEVDETKAFELAKVELEKNPKVQAVISADQEAYHRNVMKVMDWLKKAGVDDFAVSTDREIL